MPRKRINLLTTFVCLALSLPLLSWQTPDANEILRKVSKVYSDSQEYEVNATLTSVDTHASVHLFVRLPDKYRMEMRGQVVDDRGPQLTDEIVTVFDGSTLWVSYPKLHEYYSVADHIPNDVSFQTVDRDGLGSFRDILNSFGKDHGETIRLIREERLTTASGSADCFVIELMYPFSSSVLWIDKTRYYVLKLLQNSGPDETAKTTIVYDTIKLHPSFPATIFKFQPPPAA
jgi:outer membrane lipoprotein-sorting protein